ncbi:MAG: hypothetical protein JWQ96_694 [Segetibacter sp.]|nr:hypothetical protein [Segetibacter sp.]
MRKLCLSLASVILVIIVNAQQATVRQIPAVRTTKPIKIDGEINEEAYKTAPVITNLVEHRPTFGKAENEGTRTEAYILYDDNAIYVGGFCHEKTRDSISTELVGRDVVGINDFIGVVFDTYNDKINGFGYYVTPLGEQYDAKYSLGNEDGSWNSVYETSTKITDSGWSFEMKIPYSAIRFSKNAVQTWGINLTRRRNKTGQQYMWNPVDRQKFGFLTQSGLWTGIENIKAPLRLSFSPYFASYLSNNSKVNRTWKNSVNGGMDVKVGISKAFTVDMTLIPDFGQVQSDNLVLNLSPFEVKYNENRTFFTEGTELFNKGNFFYSRRIGDGGTKLINATKLSGRTARGLGIGVFNAVQAAKVVNDVEVSPLTNFSVVVLDQTMKHNSSVTFVNTNVWRSGHTYDANVSAFLWDLYDKKINWNFWGKMATSQLTGFPTLDKTQGGYNYELFFGKFKGPFNFNVNRTLADNKFQQNDLGYFTNNNYLTHGFWAGYKWTKPRGYFNSVYLNFNGNYTERFLPRAYQDFSLNTNVNGQLKNLWNYGIELGLRPEQQDFYEPRINGKVFKRPGSWYKGFWLSSNRAKKYSAEINVGHSDAPKYKNSALDLNLSNQYRFNNKLTIGLSSYIGFNENNVGFAFIPPGVDTAVFGLRNRNTVENIITVKYNFNNKMGLTVRNRHYWSKVKYHHFFYLLEDGYLKETEVVTKNPNNNVNFFNVDLVYTWQFAQGSFLNLGWKNAGDNFNQLVDERYYRNLMNTLKSSQQNTLSLKVIYYIDYLTEKSKMKKRTDLN